MDCVTAPHNEHKKSISYAVKNEFFLIKNVPGTDFRLRIYHSSVL